MWWHNHMLEQSLSTITFNAWNDKIIQYHKNRADYFLLSNPMAHPSQIFPANFPTTFQTLHIMHHIYQIRFVYLIHSPAVKQTEEKLRTSTAMVEWRNTTANDVTVIIDIPWLRAPHNYEQDTVGWSCNQVASAQHCSKDESHAFDVVAVS